MEREMMDANRYREYQTYLSEIDANMAVVNSSYNALVNDARVLRIEDEVIGLLTSARALAERVIITSLDLLTKDLEVIEVRIDQYRAEYTEFLHVQSELLAVYVRYATGETGGNPNENVNMGFPGGELSEALQNSIRRIQYVNEDIGPLTFEIDALEELVPNEESRAYKKLLKLRALRTHETERQYAQRGWDTYNIPCIVNNAESMASYTSRKAAYIRTLVPPPCKPVTVTWSAIERYEYLACLESWIPSTRKTVYSSAFADTRKLLFVFRNNPAFFYNGLYMFDQIGHEIEHLPIQEIKAMAMLCVRLSMLLYKGRRLDIDDNPADTERVVTLMRLTKFIIKFPTAYDFLNYYGVDPETYKILERLSLTTEYNYLPSSELALLCIANRGVPVPPLLFSRFKVNPAISSSVHLDVVPLFGCERKNEIGHEESIVEMGEMIGQGGFGSVYIVNIDGVRYVKKIIPVKTSKEMYDAMIEVGILRSLRNDYVIKIKSIRIEGTNMEIYMEYVGRTMRDYMGVLPLPTKIRILHGILKGIKYVSTNGIIHNDLKPSNIVLDEKNGYSPKLIDFGLPTITGTSPRVVYRIGGTPPFIAPERELEEPNNDYRSDLYSVGMIMKYLFETGLRYQREVDAILGGHGLDLYYKLIDVTPETRITIDDAITHPFFKVY
jgi:hypothetical protein